MDVHAFLFSDMLLLCKVLTKKSHSSNPEARMKVIRQPLIVDRLLVSEINKDNQSIGLALVYLNEYNVVSTYPLVWHISRQENRKQESRYQEISWRKKGIFPGNFLVLSKYAKSVRSMRPHIGIRLYLLTWAP